VVAGVGLGWDQRRRTDGLQTAREQALIRKQPCPLPKPFRHVGATEAPTKAGRRRRKSRSSALSQPIADLSAVAACFGYLTDRHALAIISTAYCIKAVLKQKT
jgi:hypothetical protein